MGAVLANNIQQRRVQYPRGRVTTLPKISVGMLKTAQNRHIGDKAKEEVKHLVAEDITKLFEEARDEILCKSYHNSQMVIRSVLYNVAEQVILDLIR